MKIHVICKKLLLIVSVLYFCSCVSYYDLTPEDRESIRQISRRLAGQIKTEQAFEHELISDGIQELLSYVVTAGPDSCLSELETVRTIAELKDYMLHKLRKTPMEMGLDAFLYWDETRPYDYELHKADVLEYESEHYVYRVFKNTQAQKDMEKIMYLCEKYISDLTGFINPDGTVLKRFENNFSYLNNNKITLTLPPNSKYWKGFNKTASMNFGYSFDDRGLKIEIGIALPYYNSLSTAVLTHEITHMVDLLFKIDLGRTESFSYLQGDEQKKRFREWWTTILRDIFPHDTPLGEGFAEYTSFKFSIFYRDLVLKPEERLHATGQSRKIRTRILKRPAAAWNRKIRLLQYTELQSLVTFIIEKYGKDKFIDFYFNPPLSEERFIAFYNKSYSAIEREWRMYYGF
ncbi:MAG: hypothetical protein JW822_04185 [Spirochaetales bacterium]|nr:hypothetical protein [Spirochaetales bacterium]